MTKAPSHIYNDDVRERAISRDSLNTRLVLNSRYQSADFHAWLHRRLAVAKGEHVLDVGCGTGAQTLRFLDSIGRHGTVSALDISPESVEELLRSAGGDPRVTAKAADMANLDTVIRSDFRQQTYTLAHSSYALYYSPARLDVLKRMAESLMSTGRVAVFTPATPHGMVDIARQFSTVPDQVLESLEFGPTVLEPAFRDLFWDVEIHFFQSEMRVTALEDFMKFYAATTYYDAKAEDPIRKCAQTEIARRGAVVYAKNGYLIMGRDRR